MIAGGEFKGVDNPYGPGGGPREPQHWKTGIEEGTHDDEDYARTHALTRKLTELRTDELRKERGLMELRYRETHVSGEAGRRACSVVRARGRSRLVGQGCVGRAWWRRIREKGYRGSEDGLTLEQLRRQEQANLTLLALGRQPSAELIQRRLAAVDTEVE